MRWQLMQPMQQPQMQRWATTVPGWIQEGHHQRQQAGPPVDATLIGASVASQPALLQARVQMARAMNM